MERSVTSKLLLLPDLIKALRNIATSCMLQLVQARTVFRTSLEETEFTKTQLKG